MLQYVSQFIFCSQERPKRQMGGSFSYSPWLLELQQLSRALEYGGSMPNVSHHCRWVHFLCELFASCSYSYKSFNNPQFRTLCFANHLVNKKTNLESSMGLICGYQRRSLLRNCFDSWQYFYWIYFYFIRSGLVLAPKSCNCKWTFVWKNFDRLMLIVLGFFSCDL